MKQYWRIRYVIENPDKSISSGLWDCDFDINLENSEVKSELIKKIMKRKKEFQNYDVEIKSYTFKQISKDEYSYIFPTTV